MPEPLTPDPTSLPENTLPEEPAPDNSLPFDPAATPPDPICTVTGMLNQGTTVRFTIEGYRAFPVSMVLDRYHLATPSLYESWLRNLRITPATLAYIDKELKAAGPLPPPAEAATLPEMAAALANQALGIEPIGEAPPPAAQP
jgi:hypothetical protein